MNSLSCDFMSRQILSRIHTGRPHLRPFSKLEKASRAQVAVGNEDLRYYHYSQ
jgi:hypothetical protein